MCLSFCGDSGETIQDNLSSKEGRYGGACFLKVSVNRTPGHPSLNPSMGWVGVRGAGWVSELLMGLHEYKTLNVSNKISFIDFKEATHT